MCDVTPGCNAQVIQVTWTTSEPGVDACRALQEAARSWESVGSEAEAREPHVIYQACDVGGTLDGHPAGAQVLSEGAGDIIITFSASW